ncbi:hypothetical protein ABGB07_04000 [Micromonosporaceae bacterium B7E4]
MRALPSLPGCGARATIRLEVYSPKDGRAHGSLDAIGYACDTHVHGITQMLHDAGLTVWRDPNPVHGADQSVCGRLRRFDTPEPAEVSKLEKLAPGGDGSPASVAAFIALGKVAQPHHPLWCAKAETAPMHYSTAFPVADRIAVQVQQEHRAAAPVVALILGTERRGVSFPLDVAAALARQLAAAVWQAGGR